MKKTIAVIMTMIMVLAIALPVTASDSAMTRGEFIQLFAESIYTTKEIDRKYSNNNDSSSDYLMERSKLFEGKPYMKAWSTFGYLMYIDTFLIGNEEGTRNQAKLDAKPSDNVGDVPITKLEVLFTIARNLYPQEISDMLMYAGYESYIENPNEYPKSIISVYEISENYETGETKILAHGIKEGTPLLWNDCKMITYLEQALGYENKNKYRTNEIIRQADASGVSTLHLLKDTVPTEYSQYNKVIQNHNSGTILAHVYLAARVLQEHGVTVADENNNVNWTKTMSRDEIAALMNQAYKKEVVKTTGVTTPTTDNTVKDNNIYIGNPTTTTNSSPIKVTLNGAEIKFLDQTPVNIEGKIFVPVASIANMLGSTVNWDGATQTVTIIKDGKTINLVVNSATAFINGSPLSLEVPPKIVNGRTMVPVRFIAEAFNMNVEWVNSTVVITNK